MTDQDILARVCVKAGLRRESIETLSLHLEGISLRGICLTLELGLNTVRSRLQRAKLALKKTQLTDEEFDALWQVPVSRSSLPTDAEFMMACLVAARQAIDKALSEK